MKTRTCKACDGTGYETAQCPKGEGGAICNCLDHRCAPCRGTGQVSERIPASDAIADAETFYRVLVPLAALCPEARRRVKSALRATDLCWRVRTAHDATIGRNGTYMGTYMARAAFRAVPGLRG